MFHVVRLSTDQATQVKNNPARFVTLSSNSDIGVLECSQFLLVSLAFTLKLLGNLLLEDKCLEGIISLLLSTSKTDGKAGIVVLLLVNETGESSVLPLVSLDLDLKILSFLGKRLSKRLELEEL